MSKRKAHTTFEKSDRELIAMANAAAEAVSSAPPTWARFIIVAKLIRYLEAEYIPTLDALGKRE
jgi:hypothetical protein